jgi:hypothetical protein
MSDVGENFARVFDAIEARACRVDERVVFLKALDENVNYDH